ncbi:hypothetical protein AAE478_001509 [Parahypoxylon ruwenzoriense]
MGLGKTVQALALILARPSRDRFRKTTLIVAPVSLLKQWQQEIQTKVKPGYKLKTLIFHGQAKRGMTVARLLTYDIVLTTYGTVTWEYKCRKKSKKPKIILAPDAIFHRVILDEAHNIKNRNSKTSIAVSDIKATYRLCMTGTPFMNRAEEIFSLIRFLRIAPYNVWEVFKWDINRPITSPNEHMHNTALKKLQALFRSITLRRTKASMLDGKPILRLPTLTREETMTKFNEEQQAFYEALEKKQQLKMNEFIRAGTAMRKYTYILVLLLRLRQACCHPHLIRDFGIPEGAQLGSDEMRNLALDLDDGIVQRLKEQAEFECPICNEITPSPLILYPCGHPICSTCFSALMEVREPNSEEEYSCPHSGCDSEIDPERVICHCYFAEVHMPDKSGSESSGGDDSDGFESLDEEDDEVDTRGNLKGFVVSDDEEAEVDSKESDIDDHTPEVKPRKPSMSMDEVWKDVSQHKDSTKETTAQDSDKDDSDNDSLESLEAIWRRVEAMKNTSKDKLAQAKKEADMSESVPSISEHKKAPRAGEKRKRPSGGNVSRPRKKRKSGGRPKERRHKNKKEFTSLAALKKASSSNATAKAKYLKRLRQDWVPSAKINKTMEILCSIRDRNPNEKTLVFSLWTSFLDLLEIPVYDQGFRYTRYDGTMHPSDRDGAVKEFMKKPGVQIMLVSLTAGNAGLNLTEATQVIILEPFWNPFVEDQAIDRAHRIGQKRDVTVHRVLIEGTVEDRIRKLQESKRKLVNAALSEEGAQSMGRLNLSQLRGLFGLR